MTTNATAGPEESRAGRAPRTYLLELIVNPTAAEAEPICKFEEGCHRVVPCLPGCGAVPAVVSPPTDRAALRKAVAEALYEHWDVHGNDADLADDFDCCADAVLAALPAERGAGTQQPECAASISGNCLAEAQSERVCDTDAGECVHGGRPAGAQQQPAAEAPCCSDPTCACVQVNAEGRCECVRWGEQPAPEQQAAAADDEKTWFGMPGCTCRAFTRQGGPPRYLEPHETVDKVSGWEPGADCPHHAPRP